MGQTTARSERIPITVMTIQGEIFRCQEEWLFSIPLVRTMQTSSMEQIADVGRRD
jgi:hypothetical protein